MVYDTVSGDLANYVLHNADSYSQLADEIIDQYQTAENLESFNTGVSQWWGRYGNQLSNELLSNADNQRAGRLAELAQLDKQVRSQFGDKQPNSREFSQLLQRQLGGSELLKEFPAAGGTPNNVPRPNLPQAKGLPTGKSGPPTVPKQFSVPNPGATPRDLPTTGRIPIQRAAPNPTQQLAGARSMHAGMWRGMPSMRGGPRPGGGGPRPGGGGPRPGPKGK